MILVRDKVSGVVRGETPGTIQIALVPGLLRDIGGHIDPSKFYRLITHPSLQYPSSS